VRAVARASGGAGAEPLAILEIDPARLRAPLRFEAPAPIPGSGAGHLASGELFPHLYGPLELEAVAGAAILERTSEGFAWPPAFGPLEMLLLPDVAGWAVWRCDEHGNEFEVRSGLGEEEARRIAADFEARGHKQSYRVVPSGGPLWQGRLSRGRSDC
jgi:uncharacterized protein (DUF952 family)